MYLRIGLLVAALLSVYGGYSYVTGLQQDIKDRDAAIAQRDNTIHTLEDSAKDTKRTETIVQEFQPIKTEVQYVTREVTKNVIQYRDRVVNRCQLDPEWVRTYNDSIQELTATDTTRGANDTSGNLAKIVDDATALDVVTANNRLMVFDIKRFITLQIWAEAPLKEKAQ